MNISIESELLSNSRGLLPHHWLRERVEGDGLDGLFSVHYSISHFDIKDVEFYNLNIKRNLRKKLKRYSI